MGTYSFSILKSELLANLGNRDDLTDARLGRFINMAQMRLARMRSFYELEDVLTWSFTATTATFTLPAVYRKINSIVVINGSSSKKLRRLLQRTWDLEVPYPTALSTGQPLHYVLYEKKIELYPIPDITYSAQARVSLWPTDLALDASLSDFEQKDDLIIMLATVLAFNSLGDKDKAATCWQIFQTMLSEAMGEDMEEPDLDVLPGPAVTTGGPGGQPWTNPFISGGQ